MEAYECTILLQLKSFVLYKLTVDYSDEDKCIRAELLTDTD
jgi:hypothetical protein